ncbi:MAG: tyrosine-type recombinase/integrase, partial [Candidatus Entotheonellia bacterium]
THLLGLNRAASTLDGYRTDVEQFCAFCERQGLTPPELTRVHLLSHLAALAQQAYQATSRARKTHAIKGFFQFLHEAEALPKHPFATIPSPRVEKRERRVLSEAEYQALREQARQRSPRDVVVVELLLQTWLRASELCGLQLGDLHVGEPGKPALLLGRQGKGKKDRVVPLNSVAEQAVRAALETREDRRPTAPLPRIACARG